ncbi:unnamed protein product, partial [Symbiodinium pilosum]
LPTVGAATRGSITGAMAAAHPDVREEALRNLQSIRQQYPEHPGFAVEPVDEAGSAMGPPASPHHDRPCQRHRGQLET